MMRFKAEVVLAVLLAVRHRTVGLAGLLAVVTVLAAHGQAGTTLVVAGSLAAVAASRILARGPALTAARWSAAPAWFAPVGRLVGIWVLVLPVIVAVSVAFPASDGGPSGLRLGMVAGVYTAAVAAVTAGLTPFAGATAAGAAGLLAVWLGAIPPAGMAAMLRDLPFLQRPTVLLWNVLPLDWRAARWLRAETAGDAALLVAWIVGGVLLAAFGVMRGAGPRRGRGEGA